MSTHRSAETTVHTREIDKSQQDTFVRDFLRPCLPYSLPLLRRCQFHQKNDKSAGSAEIWLASTSTQEGNPTESEKKQSPPWIAAHIDLTNAGQTQVWVFASWEPQYANGDAGIVPVKESAHLPIYQKLVNALFNRLRDHHIKILPETPPVPWQRLKDGGKILSLPYSRSKVLFGTVAECLWLFLDEHDSTAGPMHVTREDRPYLKYVVRSKLELLRQVNTLEGLHFGRMGEDHLQTIIDRTNIPRSIETLRQLPNMGLFNADDIPVSWGLLGKDASLSSLHTEPEYRRRGLALAVASKLISDQGAVFSDLYKGDEQDTAVYSHADVSPSNLASRNVMEKLGGKVTWRVAWIEVKLDEINQRCAQH